MTAERCRGAARLGGRRRFLLPVKLLRLRAASFDSRSSCTSKPVRPYYHLCRRDESQESPAALQVSSARLGGKLLYFT